MKTKGQKMSKKIHANTSIKDVIEFYIEEHNTIMYHRLKITDIKMIENGKVIKVCFEFCDMKDKKKKDTIFILYTYPSTQNLLQSPMHKSHYIN